MRDKIVIDFTSKYPLQTGKCLGYRGEHNATEVIIIPPNDMKNNNDITYYRVSFGFECGKPFSLPYIYKSVVSDAFSIKIPSDVTINPVVSLQLEGYSDKKDLLIKSQTIQGLTFAPSSDVSNVTRPGFEIEPSIKDSIGDAGSGLVVLEYDDEGHAKDVLVYGDLPSGISLDSDSRIERVVMINSTKVPKRMFAGMKYLQTVVLPSTITTIGESAFNGSSISNIIIPDSVTKIEKSAFYKCNNLTEIVIPDSVLDIGESAFEECDNLRTATLSQKMTRINKNLFKYCDNLSEVSNISSVTYIGKEAFLFCSKLKNIILPPVLKTVDESAFSGCIGLSEIELPASLRFIYPRAFGSCGFSRIAIPYGVTKISEAVFAGCENLSEVIMPNSVTGIDNDAFRYCYNLTNINIPSSVLSIGNNAFESCTSLESIIIPDSVISVGTGAFSKCSSLINVILSNQLTMINESVFYECSKLTNITIPDSITTIKSQSFYSCKSLESINIPDSVTIIEYNAFCGSGLITAEIGTGITQITSGAFASCSSLIYVYIKATTPPNLESYRAFPTNSYGITYPFEAIYVAETDDDSILNAYKNATNWNSPNLTIKEWGGYLTEVGDDASTLTENDIDNIINNQ